MARFAKALRRASVALLAVSALAGQARANIIPVFQSPPVANGANWTYNYTASVTDDQKVMTGDFITFYDIQGYISASAPAGWTPSSQNLGPNAPLTGPTDNSAVPNVTFTYSGSAIVGAQPLGTFSIVSSLPVPGNSSFTAQATAESDTTGTRKLSNIGTIEVPMRATPEPSGLALLLPTLAPLGLLARRRRGPLCAPVR